jgi:hypothetical protein
MHQAIRNRQASTIGYSSALVVASILACVTPQAQATLIATDHFLGGTPGDPLLGEYDNTVFLNQFRRGNTNGGGQNPTIAGFVNPWSGNVTSGSLGVAQWTAEVDGVVAGYSYEAGGRARRNGLDNLQRRVQRELDVYTPADTYYMSFTSQVLTNELDLDGFVGIGFTNTGATVTTTDANLVSGSGLRGLLIGAAGDGVAGTDYVVRHVGSTGAVQNDIILNDIVQNNPDTGTPYLRYTVVRLDFNDDPLNPNGNSKITIWQDPTVFTSELDATNAAAPLVFRTFALDTNADITHMTMTGIDYSRAASFDEPRFATTWEDVVPDPIIDGDLDGDGFVGIADLNIVLGVWNQNVTPGDKLQGDPSGDGFVGIDDLNFVLGNWNAGTPPATTSVPEPASLALIVIGGALGLQRRR